MTDVRSKRNKFANKKRVGVWETAMTAPLIFLLFRIPLANIMGNEGNGYLAVSWELYIFTTIFLTHGISAAVYEMVKKRVQKNLYHNSVRVFSVALGLSITVSILSGIIIYFSSHYIYPIIYGVRTGAISFKVFTIYLPVAALCGSFRGYFEGMGSKMPTHYSKIAEAVVAGTGGLLLGGILNSYGEKVSALLFDTSFKAGFGAAGVILGLLSGALVALCLLLVIYKIYQLSFQQLLKKDDTRIFEKYGSIIKEMIYMIIITTAPVLFLKIYRIISFTLYQKSLAVDQKINGIRYIGSYHGKIILLVYLAVTVILGFTCTGIGRLRRTFFQEKIKLCRRYYWEEIKVVLISSVILSIALFAGGRFLLNLLFQTVNDYEVTMLKIGAIGVVLISVATYNYRIFSSFQKNLPVFIIFLIAFTVQMAALLLILNTNISAFSIIIAEMIFWAATLILQMVYLSKLLKLTQRNV